MTASGASTMEVLGQVRQMFEEVAKLLGTADSMMESRGWKRRAANTITAGTSASLYAPRRWMPHTVFRFYGRPDRPNLLASVSVLLGLDPDMDDSNLLPEPMVCGLLFDYGEGKSVGDNWKYDFASWHLLNRGAMFDGTIQASDLHDSPAAKELSVERMYSLAVPLLAVTDSAQLEKLIVSPIVTLDACK